MNACPALPRALLCLLLGVSSSAIAEVTVKDAWVRGTVPAQKSTGAFLTITSSDDAKLVGASSPIAAMAEVHVSENKGGVMHMHAMEFLPLPAGKPVELKPGASHIMLMELRKPVLPGEPLAIALTIEDRNGKRSTVEVMAAVRPLGR